MPLVPFRASGPDPIRAGPRHAGLGAMWRWAAHLLPVGAPVSLGEGGAPLTSLQIAACRDGCC